MYSCVTCCSTATWVLVIAAITGETGSRVWKSIGPYLTCRMTLGRNRPHATTAGSSGSAVGRPPTRTGAAKLTDRCTRTPYPRKIPASQTTSSSRSVSRRAAAPRTLTLLSATALMPVAAMSLA